MVSATRRTMRKSRVVAAPPGQAKETLCRKCRIDPARRRPQRPYRRHRCPRCGKSSYDCSLHERAPSNRLRCSSASTDAPCIGISRAKAIRFPQSSSPCGGTLRPATSAIGVVLWRKCRRCSASRLRARSHAGIAGTSAPTPRRTASRAHWALPSSPVHPVQGDAASNPRRSTAFARTPAAAAGKGSSRRSRRPSAQARR